MVPNRKSVKALARSVVFNKNQIINNFIISFIFQLIPYMMVVLIPLILPTNENTDDLIMFILVLVIAGSITLGTKLKDIVPLFVGNLHMDYDSQEIKLEHAFKNISNYINLVVGVGMTMFIVHILNLGMMFILSTIVKTKLSVPFMLFGLIIRLVFSFKFKFVYTYMAYNNSLDLLSACNASWNATNFKVIWELIKLDITFLPYYGVMGVIFIITEKIVSSYPIFSMLVFLVVYIFTSTCGMYMHMVMLIYWDSISNYDENRNNIYTDEYYINYENNYM